jgi:hypothetical protein
MGDTKWADVAHYYAKSQIDLQIKNRDHAERFLMVSFRNVGGSHFEEWVNDGVYWRAYGSQFSAWDDHKPFLRHRDDMIEADAMALWKSVANRVDFDDSVYAAYGSPLVIYRSKFKALQPEEFHCAIQLGFDVFGLIESGQAIRKEAGNGDF